MSEIRPAEVTEILKKELAGLENASQFEEIGVVLEVGDGIARIYGLRDVQSGELIEFKNGTQAIVLNLESDHVGAVLMSSAQDIKQGDIVKRTRKIASIKVGKGMLGRVVDCLGNPIDGKGEIDGQKYEMPLERKAPGVLFREPVSEPLQTGVKAIDSMIPI